LFANFKPPLYQAAFTLLELIIVVAILAILTAYVATRPDSSSAYYQDTIAEQLVASGRLAQQLSMNDSARNFALVVAANQIDLTVNGASFASTSETFPIVITNTVTLSPATTITFDNLGATAATTITVQGDTAKLVCFESSGFIHRC
jgi:prepilin-type N-terminal cleavage/methylation domain-containing protein